MNWSEKVKWNIIFKLDKATRWASTTFDYSQIEQQTFESAPLSLRNSVIRGLSVPNTHRDWYGEEAGEELAGTPALGTNNTTIPAAYYAYYYHNAKKFFYGSMNETVMLI